MTVVVLIRVVGIILVIALLTAPAATASLITADLKKRVVFSALFGILFSIGGLWISYSINIASGASIVILSVVCYLAAVVIHSVASRSKIKQAAALKKI